MGDLSADAVSHAWPFLQVAGATITAGAALIVGFWKGFKWLDTQITERFSTLISEWTEANDRRHEEHARAIADLRERDSERASAIKRTHERIDAVMERLAPP